MSELIPGAPLPRRTRAMVITGGILAAFLAALDTTALATVLPTIVDDLGGLSLYSWVFSAYMVMSAVSMPLWGKLTDMYGCRRLFVASVVVFLLGSVLAGAASTMHQLILFRGLQGIGAGGLASVPFALVSTAFPVQERGKALGVLASAWGVSSVLGPVIGSALVLSLHWRWVFYINLPLGAAAVFIVVRHITDTAPRRSGSLDVAGAVLLAVTIVAALTAVLRFGQERSLSDPLIGAAALVSVVSLVFFIRRESRAENPLIRLEFFARRAFAAGNLLGFFAAFAMFGIIAYLPLFAQTLAGGTALQAGLIITPMSLSWSTASATAGRLANRVGELRLIRTGAVVMAAGFSLALMSSAASPLWYLMICAAVLGAGMGCQTPSLMLTVQHSLPHGDVGVATSTQMLSRSIGGAVGVAALGALLWGVVGAGLAGAATTGGPAGSPENLFGAEFLASMPAGQRGNLLGVFTTGMKSLFAAGFVVMLFSLVFSRFLPPRSSVS